MITQKQFLDYMSNLSLSQTAPEIKKAEFPDKKQYMKFEAVLGQTVDKETVRTSQERTSASRKNEVMTEKPVAYKAYREIADRAESVKRLKENKGTESVRDKSEKIEKDEDKPDKKIKSQNDQVINLLSQLFGVKPQDLETLLGAVNVKPEDLADPGKIPAIVQKLTDLIGLDEEQKNTLTAILSKVSEQIPQTKEEKTDKDDKTTGELDKKTAEMLAEILSKSRNQGSTTTDNKLVASGNTTTETEAVPKEKAGTAQMLETVKNVPAEFEQIVLKLRNRLEEMTQSMQKDPSKFMTVLATSIKELLTKEKTTEVIPDTAFNEIQAEEKTDVAAAANTEKEVKPLVAEKDVSKDLRGEKSAGIKNEAAASEDSRKADTSVKVEKPVEAVATGSKDVSAAKTATMDPGMAAVQKETPVENIGKQLKEVQQSKQEIIKQVVEKAKVVITGEKSEMVMELKPDNLGRLALKVVTERGMVVAKFVAESQQVKEVLETNMQFLKDTLEKQGLSVHSFSVSVGHDQSNGHKGYRELYMDRDLASKNENFYQTSVSGVSGLLSEEKKINPYMWSDSKINLTA